MGLTGCVQPNAISWAMVAFVRSTVLFISARSWRLSFPSSRPLRSDSHLECAQGVVEVMRCSGRDAPNRVEAFGLRESGFEELALSCVDPGSNDHRYVAGVVGENAVGPRDRSASTCFDEQGHPITYANVGENLTIAGIEWGAICPWREDRRQAGSAISLGPEL